MIEKIRFRTVETSTGQLVVLQVRLYEERYGYTTPSSTWRDAKVEDLLEVGQIINDSTPPMTIQG